MSVDPHTRALRALACALAAGAALAQSSLEEAYARAVQLRDQEHAAQGVVVRAFRAALDQFLALSPRAPDYAKAVPLGARAAAAVGDAGLAADLFAAALEREPRDPADFEGLLRADLDAGRFDAFLRAAYRERNAFPAEVRRVMVDEGGVDRGQAVATADRWLRSGDTDAGLWAFRYPVEERGHQPVDLANLALALRHLGRREECEATYREALAAAGNDALLWNDYALFLKGTHRDADAERALLESLRVESPPGSGPATANLVAMRMEGRTQVLAEPVAALRRVLSQRPDAEMPRRLYLDLLCPRADGSGGLRAGNPGRAPDNARAAK